MPDASTDVPHWLTEQLAAIRAKIKVNPFVLEPIKLPAARRNFDAAIERGQLGAAKRDAVDLSTSINAAAQRGLMSTFLKG
jgi:hypothetical protein